MLPTGINVVSAPKPVQATKTIQPTKTTRYQVLPVNYEPGPNLISPREFEVLQLLLAGKSGKDMATELKIAEKTVKWHKTHLFVKYKVKNVTQLFAALLTEKDARIKLLEASFTRT